jgi:hypothetical protein
MLLPRYGKQECALGYGDSKPVLLVAQWTSPDTIGADELFWRGVLDPRDRALDQALVGQPRLVFRRGRVNRH